MASVALAFDVLAKDKASRTFNTIGDSVDRTGGKLGKLGHGFATFGKVAALGLGAAVVGAAALGKSFVDAAFESQKVTKQTEAVLTSMGGAAGVTAEQVADLSEKLAMQTGIDDELIQSGQNVLLTFGKVQNKVGKGNKIFDRATEAALNMSVALGTDMQGATIQVGKALNDPIKGITALSRAGVSFSQKQKDQIKAMVAYGDTLGAQKIILGELEKQFGGSAEAQATAGDRLRVIWGNLQEDLGERLIPVFETVATWLTTALPAAIDFIRPIFEEITGGVSAFVAAFMDGGDEVTSSGLAGFIENLGVHARNAADAIVEFVQNAMQSFSDWWDENGDNVINFFEDLGSAVETAWGFLTDIATVIKDEVLPRLTDFAGYIGENKPAFDIFRGLILGLAGAWAIYSASAVIAGIATLAPLAPFILLIGAAVLLTIATQALADVFSDQLNTALQWLVDRASDIIGFFSDLLDLAVRALAAVEALKQALPDVDLPGGGVPIPIPDLVPGFDVPLLPWADDGGVWPGPKGVHSLGWVAGGETLVPTHKSSFDAAGEDRLLELRRQTGYLSRIAGAVDRGPSIADSRAISAVRR